MSTPFWVLMLGGVAQAVVLAAVLWWLDRRRQQKLPGTFEHVYSEIARVELEAKRRHDDLARDIRVRFEELGQHDEELVAKAGREFYRQINDLMYSNAQRQAFTGQRPFGRRKSDLVKAAAEDVLLNPAENEE